MGNAQVGFNARQQGRKDDSSNEVQEENRRQKENGAQLGGKGNILVGIGGRPVMLFASSIHNLINGPIFPNFFNQMPMQPTCRLKRSDFSDTEYTLRVEILTGGASGLAPCA